MPPFKVHFTENNKGLIVQAVLVYIYRLNDVFIQKRTREKSKCLYCQEIQVLIQIWHGVNLEP